MTRVDGIPRLPPREPDSHKGTFGRVLVVAGSRGMTGAAILCGTAALRGGAGLVQVACPRDVQEIVASGNPCYTTLGLGMGRNGQFDPQTIDEVVRNGEQATVLALGPGMGNRSDVGDVVRAVLMRLRDKPLVLDADALNTLPLTPDVIRTRSGSVVMTPHPGEFARFCRTNAAGVQANRESLAVTFAKTWNLVLLLKGHRTIVTDGTRVYTNTTGNPGMATGGSGDVLTGLIAALIGQGMSAFDAACLGAWTHGRAGDMAAAEVGPVSLIATDLLRYLPAVFRRELG
ncbi:MAG TPA: NAD(P)H-hydrate dehydratase [Fimbriiglobus sp.]